MREPCTMPINSHQRDEIKRIFTEFLRRRIRAIRRLRLRDLDINPFVLRLYSQQLGLSDSESIVRWLVQQRLERGTVTALGTALQRVARVFSEGTGVEGADIMKTKDGRHYYIQVKSGPNTVPKDMARRISELLHSAQRRNAGSVALFAMCYGSPDRVSSIVRKYVEVEWIIGKEFWEFISDDPNCLDEIYTIATEVSQEFRDRQGQTISEVLEARIQNLQSEFAALYGRSGEEMWQRLLDMNS